MRSYGSVNVCNIVQNDTFIFWTFPEVGQKKALNGGISFMFVPFKLGPWEQKSTLFLNDPRNDNECYICAIYHWHITKNSSLYVLTNFLKMNVSSGDNCLEFVRDNIMQNKLFFRKFSMKTAGHHK